VTQIWVWVTHCQDVADPVSGCGSPSVRVWLTQCQVMGDLIVSLGPVARLQKEACGKERGNEEWKAGWGAALATILTDGAAHRASQAGPTQLTHLSLVM
jgi:hypothetical protein